MVIAVVDDLLFSSKIRAVASQTGTQITFVRERAAIVDAVRRGAPTLVIFDLDRDALDPVGAIARDSRDRRSEGRPHRRLRFARACRPNRGRTRRGSHTGARAIGVRRDAGSASHLCRVSRGLVTHASTSRPTYTTLVLASGRIASVAWRTPLVRSGMALGTPGRGSLVETRVRPEHRLVQDPRGDKCRGASPRISARRHDRRDGLSRQSRARARQGRRAIRDAGARASAGRARRRPSGARSRGWARR